MSALVHRRPGNIQGTLQSIFRRFSIVHHYVPLKPAAPQRVSSEVTMGSQPTATQSSLILPAEPESEQETASAAVWSHTSRCIPRSCYGCNSRKIRCDKSDPCSSCTRAGRLCAFPPLGPRKRRAKETIMADMASRISSLEKSTAKVREEQKSVPTVSVSETENATPSAQPAASLYSNNLSERSREDILVEKGPSSLYFNDILLSGVIKEVFTPMPLMDRLCPVVLTA